MNRLQQQRTLLQQLLPALVGLLLGLLLAVLILQLDVVRVGLLDRVHQLPNQAVVARRQQIVGLLGDPRVEQQRPVQRRGHRREGVRNRELAQH